MKIRFYGARGSHATSLSLEHLETLQKNIWQFSKKSKAKNWAAFKKELSKKDHSFSSFYSCHTTCVEVLSDSAPMPIYVDMGTGLSAAAADKKSGLNNKLFQQDSGEVAFFITHTHWDHVIGLPTLFRLYKAGNEFHFYGGHKNLKKRIEGLFKNEYFPANFTDLENSFHFHELHCEETIPFGKIKITMASQPHPGTSYAYRFEEKNKSFVMATDTDLSHTIAPSFPKGKNIYSNATILAVDSHFTNDDYVKRKTHGHPSIERVIDFAVSEEVKTLLLTHHNPAYSDEDLDQFLKDAYKYLYKKHGKSHSLKIVFPLEGKQLSL